MLRKLISFALVAVMLATLCLASCDKANSDDTNGTSNTTGAAEATIPADFKLGVILLHDEKSTYDLNFINGVNAAAKTLGLSDKQIIMKRNISEDNNCYEAAADLVDEGCNVIFANSFGHEDFMIKAAREFKDVQFCHATGTKAHSENLANYHNAFAQIYEGRYLAGVAAGLKLNEMIAAGKFTAEEAKIGYVGAFTYAEVISGYTSFYLGAKSVCPTVTMDVQFTGSWYDYDSEKNTAINLINGGCKLISGHADSLGAPTACEEKNVPNIAYNGSMAESCPNTFIVSSRIDWAPYFKYICEQAAAGKEIATDWVGTIATGSVALTDVNEKAAAKDTVATLKTVTENLKNGTCHVFDTSTFTVGGNAVTTKLVDGKEVIKDGYFHESEVMSAPYFDLKIDGINLLNEKF